MTTRTKRQAEALTVAYDFTNFLERVGFPHADYTQLVEAGITVYVAEIRGSVVFLTIGGGDPGESYTVGVRCTTTAGEIETINVTVNIRREITAEPINPSQAAHLTNGGGLVLVNANGEFLQVA